MNSIRGGVVDFLLRFKCMESVCLICLDPKCSCRVIAGPRAELHCNLPIKETFL